MTGPTYTVEELERAWKLRESGLKWRAVAARLGRPYNALTKTAHRYRQGLWAPHQQAARGAAIKARIEALVASGMTSPLQISRVLGLSTPALSERLLRMGLDAEMRREAASRNRMVP